MRRTWRIAVAALTLGWAGGARGQTPVASPADLYGPLFAAVQEERVFPDGKTFADAVPRRDPAAIVAEFAAAPVHGAALRAFVLANFDPPPAPPLADVMPGLPLAAHIAALWPVLTRAPAVPAPGGSLLALPRPYVVPGGRFREIYYWDTYFTMLGLARDGRADLIEAMIDDFTDLIERYGHVPNGTRSYYLSRSQPPFYFAMVGLSRATAPDVRARRLRAMRREHDFWMAGADALRPGTAARRVVRLADGALLNRYRDDRDTPRDESWREDVATARAAPRPPAETLRELRSAAESGWDFSSRWLGDGHTLATIRTTAILPIDLNSLLYGMERAIADGCASAGDRACARDYAADALRRRTAMHRYLWNAAEARFADYDWQRGRPTPVASAAMLYPLFTGAATPGEARATARYTARYLLAPGGVRTTLTQTGQQWDRPNGWAPLQWIAVAGLRRYAQTPIAARIADAWLRTVEREYGASGRLLEKYDIERTVPGGGGEYPLQDGFGWTNGVTRELLEWRKPATGGA